MIAHWEINDDAEVLCLQIELGNDQAVTLTYSKNGDPPRATLWTGSGEHSFGQDTLGSFRAWVLAAGLGNIGR